MPGPPVFLILPGATANRDRIAALRENAALAWREARVEAPDYLSRFRGVRGVAGWLERWCGESIADDDDVYAWAFILGAAALPFSPALMARIRRLVVLRSRFQEAVPRWFRRRFTPAGAAIVAGRAVADLGKPPFWPPGFAPPCPTLTLVETRPTAIARRLGVNALSDADLAISGAVEVAVDHDLAYFSQGLMRTAVEWLRDGIEPRPHAM